MRHVTAIGAIVGLLFLFGFSASAEAGEAYMPLKKGNRWVFDSHTKVGAGGFGVGTRSEAVATCTGTRTLEGRTVHEVRWIDEDGDLDLTTLVQSDDSGVEVALISESRLLLSPVDFEKKGETTSEIASGTRTATAVTESIGAEEEITVPYGKVAATPVRCRVEAPGGVVVETTTWYTRGVGPVRIIEKVNTGGAVVERRLELRSFEGEPSETDPESESPEKSREEASGAKFAALVAEAVASGSGKSPAAKRLTERVEAIVRRGESLGDMTFGPAPTTPGLDGSRSAVTPVKDAFLVCDGSFSLTAHMKDSILIVKGDVQIVNYVKDSIILATGDVQLGNYVKNSLVVSLGKLQVGNYAKDCCIEASEVALGGTSKRCVYVNTEPRAKGRKDDRVEKVEEGLRDLLR